MKISALCLLSMASASAFTMPGAKQGRSSLSLADQRPGMVDVEIKPVNGFGKETSEKVQTSVPSTPPAPTGPRKSESLPFMNVAACLDGSMAGDVGFDPLGFADCTENLDKYREAEIKHARLAMLAAAGWPLSELFDKKIATVFGMDAVLDEANRVPSVLNGGMEKISPLYWVGCIVFAGALDVVGTFSASKRKGYFPGNFQFDPLGLYPKDAKGQKWMQTAEIKNGRLAMLAITGFCFQELVTHVAVIDQTPFFFKPIFETLNAGVPQYTYPEDVVQDVAKAAISAVDSITTPALEATTVAPAVDSITAVIPEVTSVAPPVASVVPSVDSITAATSQAASVASPVDTISAAPVTNPAATVPVEELDAAKKRIVELESKLSEIRGLSN